ncbi:MAG: ImmA/IrrE family metallo-endopeptidase [Chloroflexi bacterium]|nr:ImmA/IrrE family metallo-endopeptidase [Chloroflexota bacterium]
MPEEDRLEMSMHEHILESIDPRVLGRRLQEARKARGLTQQQVAESLAVARTTVTALEKGERRIRPAELVRMAKLYARPVGDLVGPRQPMADFAVQFRATLASAGSGLAQSELQRAVGEFQRLCEDYQYLERLNGVHESLMYPPEYPLGVVAPEPAAENVASAERNRLGLGDGPVLNLRELLESDVGLRTFYVSLPSRVAGVFAYTVGLGGCVAVNALHPEGRRRWSMAHEYGHFLTSRFRPEISVLAAYERVPASERFAHAFAGSFLMPAAGLQRRFNEMSRVSGGKITAAEVCRVAHYYFVSVEAMMLRLEGLRLLPSGTWERLRDRGFKVREAQVQLGLTPYPHDDRTLPVRYQFLAVRAYQEGNLTEGELARLLRVDRVQARRTVQALTHLPHVLDEGKVASLAVDLASSIR